MLVIVSMSDFNTPVGNSAWSVIQSLLGIWSFAAINGTVLKYEDVMFIEATITLPVSPKAITDFMRV